MDNPVKLFLFVVAVTAFGLLLTIVSISTTSLTPAMYKTYESVDVTIELEIKNRSAEYWNKELGLNQSVVTTDNATSGTYVMERRGTLVTGDVYVHLLSYQRSGSSFTGGVFYSDPSAFFIYEPMDMLYSALVGISPGWSVPADIFFLREHALRVLPQDELQLSQWTLDKIFTCDMASFPAAMLIHPFWNTFRGNMPSVQDYNTCLAKARIRQTTALRACQAHIRAIKCPTTRYVASPENLVFCKDVLWNNGRWTSTEAEIDAKMAAAAGKNPKLKNLVWQKRVRGGFKKYFACLQAYKERARSCAATHLDKKCRTRTIRAVKTVRTSMDVSQKLVEKYPKNVKVIHLMRDPRGATRSRMRSVWAHGIGEGKSVASHADRYCRPVVRDHKMLKAINATHPGSAMTVVYDGFVNSPLDTVRDMFQFIGKPVPVATLNWVTAKTAGGRKEVKGKGGQRRTIVTKDSAARAVAWKSFYKHQDLVALRQQCQEFYSIIDFPWLQ